MNAAPDGQSLKAFGLVYRSRKCEIKKESWLVGTSLVLNFSRNILLLP